MNSFKTNNKEVKLSLLTSFTHNFKDFIAHLKQNFACFGVTIPIRLLLVQTRQQTDQNNKGKMFQVSYKAMSTLL